MGQQNEFNIDPRTAGDICGQIQKLARSYTPEWSFEPGSNPDAGSVIGLIFANQMADNIKKINQVIEKYHTEFVNMLNISLLPAYPACGVVIMDLIEDTIPGIDVPKGTKLLGTKEEDDSNQIVFETVSDVHITNSRIRDVVSISGHFGKIIPVFGGVKYRKDELNRELGLARGYKEEDLESEVIPQISLFDYSGDGVERNGILLYHRTMFDTDETVDLCLKLLPYESDEDLSEVFSDPARYRWHYYGQEGLTAFDGVRAFDGAVVLNKSEESKKLRLDGAEYSLIYLEALSPVTESINLKGIQVSSKCEDTPADFVVSNDIDEAADLFMPFGQTVSVFDECYIGHDNIFSQQEALVTLHFKLSVKEKLVSLSQQQEDDSLKVIKRKPRAVQFHTAETSPQRVCFEYFNGIGWQRLVTDHDWTSVFDGTHTGEISISFLCPADWQPTMAGGFMGRAIRLRVAQADNCYLIPCMHKMPQIEGLRISYSFFGRWKAPQRLRRISGTELTELTEYVQKGLPFTAFNPLPYAGNGLYLGFDKKIEGSPVSILFDIEESVHFESSSILFEYSSRTGFQPMKIIDHTRNMSCSGTVVFIPPTDFAKMVVEGQSRYWIRLTDEKGSFDSPDRYHARIRSIRPNALDIQNIETLPEESFYIDAAVPNMSFPIAAENILSAEVFVNEKNKHSVLNMRKMAEEHPEQVRVEYNFLGDITEFFVRWTEVENFDESTSQDRHYVIDRMTNTLIFGDGVSVSIPSAQMGVAFTLQAKCCNGLKGNLAKGAVNAAFRNLLYINSISNPIATYAGSNIESIASAHLRGANLLNSKNRLVSELDFVREVKSFSTSIDKVKCVVGQGIDGERKPGLICIAVMMKDFEDGSQSFNSIKDRLEDRLLKKCEATLKFDALRITEPIYAEISVDVWVHVENMENSFRIQTLIRDSITDYLNPVSGGSRGGWEIGELPTQAQIGMLLQSIRCDATIGRYIATVRFVDKDGVHERDLASVAQHPFMIGINGEHSVHLQLV